MTLLPVSEEEIAQHTTRAVYERGLHLYHESAVHQPVLRGNRLSALVKGYHHPYYQVEIEFTDTGVSHARCSCAYEWGEWCKHIVATLLVCLHRPELIETRPELTTLLEPLSREQLLGILLEVARVSEETASRIETLVSYALQSIESPAPEPTTSDMPPAPRVTDFLPDCVSEAIEALGELGEALQQLIEQGRAEDAIRIMEEEGRRLLRDTFGKDFYEYTEEGVEPPMAPLAPLLAEAILSIENPSEPLKTRLAMRLQDWHDTLNDYGMDFMGVCLLALREAWGVRVREQVNYFAFELQQIRLRLLEQRGDYQTYLEKANEHREQARFVLMLALRGDLQEATREAQKRLKSHSDWLVVVRAFYELGAVDESLQLAHTALQREDSSVPPFSSLWLRSGDATLELANWLQEHAQRHERADLALDAARVALLRRPTLPRYLTVKELAGTRWNSVRSRLLKQLQKKPLPNKEVAEIFLHEDMYEEAFDILRRSYSTTPLDMKRLVDHVPERVSAYCIKEAEAIIERTRSNEYPLAAEWLTVARQAHIVQGRLAEWRAYIESLIEQHKRKRMLVPLLELLNR
ncbi:MAG: hypothetical protein NZM28_04255 [Fimbriimonadales bacterium]|nr:hypothetical protein [Fimbriimonadales bacterium]